MKTGVAPASEPRRRFRLRSEYIAMAAVVLAILVSLAGACIVIAQASDEPRQPSGLSLALL